MLTFGIYFLTAVLVLDCVFIVLLVLVQLPKKEAGMGQAFGGAATDALFGAGSGNVLTKATKWAAALFFILAIALTLMTTFKASTRSGRLQQLMSENKPTPAVPEQPVAPATVQPTNLLNLTAPTNAPAVPNAK
jgi:preprotein translocase subunit SecG